MTNQNEKDEVIKLWNQALNLGLTKDELYFLCADFVGFKEEQSFRELLLETVADHEEGWGIESNNLTEKINSLSDEELEIIQNYLNASTKVPS